MLKTSLYPITFLVFLIIMSFSGYKFILPKDEPMYDSSDRIMIAAHRGLHHEFPENSIPAIEESIKLGIDIVEIDIRETKDNIPVLLHDKTLKRTTGHPYKIAEITYNETHNFKLFFEGKTTEYNIPSLEEVLKLTRDRIILNLDFKIDELDAMKRAYQLIEEYKMEEQVIVTIHSLKLIPELNKFNEKIRIMPVAFSSWRIKSVIQHDYLDIIQLYHRPYWKYNIKRLEKNDIDIWVNSLNKYDGKQKRGENGFEELLAVKKVDIIQTDYPEELLKFLQEKGLHD